MSAEETRRNVVLFSARYLPSMGGVENFTANLARQLASMGRDVVIVTSEANDGSIADARVQVEEGSIEVLRFNAWGPTRMPFVRRDGRYREIRERVASLAPFDALINTRFYSVSRVAAALCRKSGVRPVLVDHGTGYITFPSKALSLAFKVAEHLATAWLKRTPIDYYGVSKDASRWLATFGITSCGEIHNALDASAFAAQASDRDFHEAYGVADETLVVVYASRLLPEKGADTIVEAARELAGAAPVHFFVAGSGPMEAEVSSASDELDNLTYLGRLSHPDLAALLGQSDVFCFPTRYSEGLPTALLEAAACGCALVSADAGGVREIIPSQEEGIVLKHPDARDVVAALRGLADDRGRLAALKERAGARVRKRFTWEATAEEVLEAFGRAASR